MKRPGLTASMLWPALIVILPLLFGPLLVLLHESLKPHIAGRVGGDATSALTLENYALLAGPEYAQYFLDTFRIGLISTVLALMLGYPMAHFIVRRASPIMRRILIASLIGTLFLSLIVRIYAISMTFGSLGPLAGFSRLLGIAPTSPSVAELMVVLGLLNTTMPLVALTLIGTIQNINPRLEDAALSLGAPHWKTFVQITLAMSVPGILSAGIIGYAFCISNLVVPMLVGRGFVLFVSNLIYFRFSEVANFPSGAALSIVMMVISLGIFYGLLHLVRTQWQEAGK
ncbi:ABC transporter permease [Flaviflagellibacter deserti]|uniref:ABC transporter permease n=1 Tax=Flaviflagellibacter deserti TaxID=2267266 RepID=A0ABV9Z6U4_9HYPH